MSSSAEVKPTATLPTPVLDALESARITALDWHARIDAEREAARAAQARAESECGDAVARARNAEQALLEARAEIDKLKTERDHWHEQYGAEKDRATRLEFQLSAMAERNRELRRDLLEVHQDLMAEDLPTLILRAAMTLTHAEKGLCCDPSGERIIASVGLDDLADAPRQALFEHTREAAQQDSPVVRNEAQTLPNGLQFANLAAVPVALKGKNAGVLLVVNKRTGPFTDEDTELLLSVGRHAGVALENRRLHQALGEAYVGTVAVLADAIEAKDPYTRGHCEDVAALAVRVARQMGLQGEELDHVKYGALLHDVGKIGISDGILLKPGRLLPEEFQVIQRHAAIGSDLVSRVPALTSIAAIILHHHERFDGSGYPAGLSGDDIPLASRIISAVDALDAMTSPRPYREPVAKEAALAELRRCAGGQFDPTVIAIVEGILAGPPPA